ncbi:MAG: preprotein translocase subunit SecA, partial [Akkermansia sp.]
MIKWILTKIVGSKNQREVRRLRPIVERIVAIENGWQQTGEDRDFLMDKTREWQTYLHRFLPLSLPPVRIVESADQEQLAEFAQMLNERFDSLKGEFAGLPVVEPTMES